MIFIYSSFSNDKIFNEKGKLISTKKKGGPAFYIRRVFEKSGLPYILKTGQTIKVEIKLLKNKEIGMVKQYDKGKKFLLKPKQKIRCKNTIGAGDTLFAYFVSRFLETNNALKSIRYAISKTSEFLSSKAN